MFTLVNLCFIDKNIGIELVNCQVLLNEVIGKEGGIFAFKVECPRIFIPINIRVDST